MKTVRNIILACDFETTVYEGQTRTDVWSAAYTEVGNNKPENVRVLGNISAFIEELFQARVKTIAYFHNLKFDGMFIVDFLLNEGYTFNRVHASKLMNKEFTCSISDRGQWYTITVKRYNTVIEFRDSLKLLPMALKRVGQSFRTEHQKLDMEYKGFRYPNCPITDEELSYIKNDVLVLSEGLKSMFDMGVDGLTIGSVCMKRYKDSPFFRLCGEEQKGSVSKLFSRFITVCTG